MSYAEIYKSQAHPLAAAFTDALEAERTARKELQDAIKAIPSDTGDMEPKDYVEEELKEHAAAQNDVLEALVAVIKKAVDHKSFSELFEEQVEALNIGILMDDDEA